MMEITTTFPPENGTSASLPASSSPVGLAVGLTFFFLLLGVSAGVVIYIYRNKLIDILQRGRGNDQNKDNHKQTARNDSYGCKITTESELQTPIYENLGAKATCQKPAVVHQTRSSSEPEEDLYLQCDQLDDAIYSNDAECNLEILPNVQEEEDVYIVPDAV